MSGSSIILKQQWGKFMQTPTPGLEFVPRTIRNVRNRVVPRAFQVFDRFLYAVGPFFAAAANEHQLRFWLVFQIVRIVEATAEQAVVPECFRLVEGNHLGFHTAHRQTRHRPVVPVIEGAEIGIDVRNQFVGQDGLERVDAELPDLAPFHFVGHAVGHHDDKRLRFAFRNQVVHNQVRVSLIAPGCLVFAPAVLQVQHRILGRLVFLIARRGVHKRPARGTRAFGGKQNLLHMAVRHVFQGVKFLVVGWYLDAAFPADRPVVILGTGDR